MSDTPEIPYHHQLKNRFRGYFPVIIDVETAGFDAKKDALLELAAITLKMDENGNLQPDQNAIFILSHLRARILIRNHSNLMGLIFTIHCVVPYLN